QTGGAPVQVASPGVNGPVCRGLVDRTEELPTSGVHDLCRRTTRTPDIGKVTCPVIAGPEPASGPFAQQLPRDERVEGLFHRRTEQVRVLPGDREFLRGRTQMWSQDVGVFRVKDSGFHRLTENSFRVVCQISVQGVVPGDESSQGVVPASPRPPGLLPQGSPGPRPTCDEYRVQPTDVHPQFKRS